MAVSNPAALTPAVQELLDIDLAMPLGAGKPQTAHRDALRRLAPEELFGSGPPQRRDLAAVCLALLWLRFDFLDEAHKIVQEIENRAGSFGHAIVHRRDGDYSNSKYWLRQAGEQAIFPALAQFCGEMSSPEFAQPASRLVTGAGWNAGAFVDLCSAAMASRAPCQSAASVAWLEQLQAREWELFFDHCQNGAMGRAGQP